MQYGSYLYPSSTNLLLNFSRCHCNFPHSSSCSGWPTNPDVFPPTPDRVNTPSLRITPSPTLGSLFLCRFRGLCGWRPCESSSVFSVHALNSRLLPCVFLEGVVSVILIPYRVDTHRQMGVIATQTMLLSRHWPCHYLTVLLSQSSRLPLKQPPLSSVRVVTVTTF